MFSSGSLLMFLNSTLRWDLVSVEWNSLSSLSLTAEYSCARMGLSNLKLSNSSAASTYSFERMRRKSAASGPRWSQCFTKNKARQGQDEANIILKLFAELGNESFLDASDDESLEELGVGSFSSNATTIILYPARDDTADDNITVYCWSPASTISERGLDRAALNESIARLRGRRRDVSVVSSHYTFDSDDDTMASARYVERTYRLPSQKEHEYGRGVDESDMPGDYSWSVKDEPRPRASAPCHGRRTAEG
ncbi:hypothetical protein OUZ56_012471 [Daphnia magna]|uniref:Uncharacterized protein n=1 Tax=Daphnia magna TaxID=35525 RepID=A0ABQ9Z331_9CRUS|nr:hypothetical protein OUZ56_012471 [Daphnia magna]